MANITSIQIGDNTLTISEKKIQQTIIKFKDTIGTYDYSFTAPEDGTILVACRISSAFSDLWIFNNSVSGLCALSSTVRNDQDCTATCLCNKGDSIRVLAYNVSKNGNNRIQIIRNE